MTMLNYEGVTVKKDGKTILSIPLLTLEKGRCYGIVGPSGAGKSTFLKVTNGLQLPTSGRVTFCGEEVTTKKISLSLQRNMVYVSQHPIMFDKTVEENIGIGLQLRKESPSLIASKVKKMLERIGLEGYEKKRAITLSGGEAQRVALARAFILQPALLLLDEPTANLDPKNMLLMEEIIHTIHRETETTILIVTHNLAQAKRVSDEVLFVYEGKILERGGTEEFFGQPKSVELQEFISVELL